MQHVISTEGIIIFTKYIIKYKPSLDDNNVTFWDTLNSVYIFKGSLKDFLLNF